MTAAFAWNKNWCVAARGRVIVWSRNRERLPPKDLLLFLQQTVRLLDPRTGT